MAHVAGQNQKTPAPQNTYTLQPFDAPGGAQGLAKEGLPDPNAPHETEALFRSIADSVPIMVWTTGLDMGITFLNKIWADYTGIPVEKAMGQQWIDAFHPDDREQILTVYVTAFQKWEPFTFEARKIHHDSKYRWVAAIGVPNFGSSGEFLGYIGTCQDITERKQADEEARLLHKIILEIEALEDLDAALEIVLKEICLATGWKCGQVWMPNLKGDRFELGTPWYGKEDETLVCFRNRNRNYTYAPGEGLPGQVWLSQSPLWIEDCSHASNFPRYLIVKEAGLRSAFGVPVLANSSSTPDKKDVIAVLEFFRADFQAEDDYILRLVSSIALQLGLFIQKKIMEKKLRESESRFRIMANSTPAIIWVTDVNDQIVYLNRQWIAYTGRNIEEVQETSWWESVHPGDIEACYRKCRAAKEKRDDFSMELRLRRADGDYRWMLDTAAPRFDAEGRYIGYVGLMLDINQRKLTEEQFRESEARFRSMAEAAPFMIIMSDLEEGIYYFNQAWREFTGLDREMMRSRYWFTLQIHPDDRRFCLEKYRSAIATHRTGDFEFRMRRHDGEYRWVLASAAPRYGNEGKLVGFIGSCIDITESRRFRVELERTVAERTKELEAVNQELESFSYSVSHDLRAPLRGIDGISHLVYQDYHNVLDDQGKAYLQILRKEAQRMSELINEMLNLSRVSRGALRWECVNLSAIAEEIADFLKKQEPDRKVRFEIQKGITVYGDAHLLRAVLENLLGNSWKFSAKHATALIQFGKMERDNQTVYFVKDDGAGFEMEYAENLFGAFQRLHDSSEFPGTGIGLATVQRIIHRHGGTVWAEGEVEKGAQVFFTLGEHYD